MSTLNVMLTLAIRRSVRLCHSILNRQDRSVKKMGLCRSNSISTSTKTNVKIDGSSQVFGTCFKKNITGAPIVATQKLPLLAASPNPLWSCCRTYAKKKGKEKGGKDKKNVEFSGADLEGVVNLEKVTEEMDTSLEELKQKFIHQVTVRTSHGVFNNITVKTPDGNFPLIQLAQVSQKSPQLVIINVASAPQYIVNVREAVENSGLNVNPQQEGTNLYVPIPKVTREHREGLVKSAKMLSEKSKKQIRDTYSKYSKKIKGIKAGVSSDVLKGAEEKIKDLMKDKLKQVEDMTERKQKELLGN